VRDCFESVSNAGPSEAHKPSPPLAPCRDQFSLFEAAYMLDCGGRGDMSCARERADRVLLSIHQHLKHCHAGGIAEKPRHGRGVETVCHAFENTDRRFVRGRHFADCTDAVMSAKLLNRDAAWFPATNDQCGSSNEFILRHEGGRGAADGSEPRRGLSKESNSSRANGDSQHHRE
jgi:hypothetical protein